MNKRVLGVLVLIVVLAGASIAALSMRSAFAPSANVGSTTPPATTSTSTPTPNAAAYAGTISTDASGQQVYTNTRYGFRFSYPNGWRVGDNILGMPFGGSLQLFNTATSGDSGQTSGFARGENKVEVSVIDAANTSALLHPSSTDDGPETITSLSTASGGMSVPGADMTYAGGTHLRLFILPMPSMPESSLMFVIYGDPSNFDTLNVIIQSVRFTQAKG